MSSLTFPDGNVWSALLRADHVHRDSAKRWWAEDDSEVIGSCCFVPEHADIERAFRKAAATSQPSPKSWADASLAAFAEVSGGRLVTFDHALAKRSKGAILLA